MSSASSYQEDDDQSPRKNDLVFKCPLCGSRFRLYAQLSRHMRDIHPSMDLFLSTCIVCTSQFSSWKSLEKHIQVSHQNCTGFRCPQCKKIIMGSLSELSAHVYAEHPDTKPFQCSLCSQSFLLREDVQEHVRNELETKIIAVANVAKDFCHQARSSRLTGCLATAVDILHELIASQVKVDDNSGQLAPVDPVSSDRNLADSCSRDRGLVCDNSFSREPVSSPLRSGQQIPNELSRSGIVSKSRSAEDCTGQLEVPIAANGSMPVSHNLAFQTFQENLSIEGNQLPVYIPPTLYRWYPTTSAAPSPSYPTTSAAPSPSHSTTSAAPSPSHSTTSAAPSPSHSTTSAASNVAANRTAGTGRYCSSSATTSVMNGTPLSSRELCSNLREKDGSVPTFYVVKPVECRPFRTLSTMELQREDEPQGRWNCGAEISSSSPLKSFRKVSPSLTLGAELQKASEGHPAGVNSYPSSCIGPSICANGDASPSKSGNGPNLLGNLSGDVTVSRVLKSGSGMPTNCSVPNVAGSRTLPEDNGIPHAPRSGRTFSERRSESSAQAFRQSGQNVILGADEESERELASPASVSLTTDEARHSASTIEKSLSDVRNDHIEAVVSRKRGQPNQNSISALDAYSTFGQMLFLLPKRFRKETCAESDWENSNSTAEIIISDSDEDS